MNVKHVAASPVGMKITCETELTKVDGRALTFSVKAFDEAGLDPSFYANRRRDFDEILPWDHLDYGISKKFLMNENKKAHESVTTPHCRIKCAGCGANRLNGGKCDARSEA